MMIARASLLLALATPLLAQPPKRAHHAIVYDVANSRVLVTGGSSPYENGNCCAMFNDLWAFDGSRWTALPSSGAQMSGMRLAFDSRANRVVSFGGWIAGQSQTLLRALDRDTWTALAPLTEMPASEPGFVYDSRRNRFVAFGGSAGRGQQNGDTWEYDGATWTKVASSGPPGRQMHTMVYDERRGRTVVFGGIQFTAAGQPPQKLGDVWEFDGSTWTKKETVGGPSAREGNGAAYDSKRGLVLVFGGNDANGFKNDLWAWNGTAWRQLDAGGAGRPDARAMGYIAYDSKRDRVVLFGGRKGWPNDLNDTWEWDGTAWQQLGTRD
jgi:hypothetical protein